MAGLHLKTTLEGDKQAPLPAGGTSMSIPPDQMPTLCHCLLHDPGEGTETASQPYATEIDVGTVKDIGQGATTAWVSPLIIRAREKNMASPSILPLNSTNRISSGTVIVATGCALVPSRCTRTIGGLAVGSNTNTNGKSTGSIRKTSRSPVRKGVNREGRSRAIISIRLVRTA
ncbi:MAG: hypothetical protein FD153_2076 [Rhodospirillaceae bacterium]|nr:MAG: hypothetical protein FD153_2076 [Rhodospirillaceae bacterium]